jgi:acetoin utilization deacetylase AcuC-like enzyme
MTTLLLTHPACAGHDTGPGHPEAPLRLRAIAEAVEKADLIGLECRDAPRASREQVELVHPARYVDALEALGASGRHGWIDADTAISPGSMEAAYRAAGAVCAAIDAVLAGEAANAFCAVRPPGHHAEPERAMGFCLFSTVAIGARHARAAHGLTRIAILDFDVHHGNGTQAVFERDPDTLYLSTHQWPLFPGTGAARETGVGNIVNRPLPPGTGSADWRAVVEDDLLPAIDAFAPELILVSAGFDAHRADPLASLGLVEDDFAWITAELLALAKRHAHGRLVSTLEGGYNPVALGRSCVAHLQALMEG